MVNAPQEVKTALKNGGYRKNYRINVLNDDKSIDFTIDNNNLVADSVNIDEKLCTGETLKFGLCEGTSIEFQYFDKPSILNRQISVFIDIEYPTEQGTGSYEIALGFFDIKEVSRQASTGIKKVLGYNKLQSDYLDAKANNLVKPYYSADNVEVTMYDIKHLMLGNYAIEPYEVNTAPFNEYGNMSMMDDASATKFTNYWGDRGFDVNDIRVNGTTYLWASPTSEFKLGINSSSRVYNLDPTKYYRIDSKFDLDKFEQSFYDYMCAVINKAGINIATNTYMSNLIKNASNAPDGGTRKDGWRYIFCIMLTKSDDTFEYYSLLMKKNGMAVAGTMGDLSHKLFKGYKKLRLWMPDELTWWYTTSQLPIPLINFYGEDAEYTYYNSKNDWLNENGKTGVIHAFTYPDGTRIGESGLSYDITNPEKNYFSVVSVENLNKADLIKTQVGNMPDYSLRDIASATYEMNCLFGQLNRETDLFGGVELSQGNPVEVALKDMYSQLWADEGNIHKWKYLIITYKGLDSGGNETEYKLQRTIDEHGTDNYNCSDNWIFRNLTWTAEQIGEFADAMVQKMRNVTWFPFELWCAGLPYIETGDKIQINLGNESYTSYVLQRQLKGIQDLQDTYINGKLDIF